VNLHDAAARTPPPLGFITEMNVWDEVRLTEPSSASSNRSKLKTADPERKVEPCLALYRQRLQDKRALGAAN
jgi:hypothetical protein